MRYSENLYKLPPYIFIEIDKKKRAAREAGKDLIDLGIGDPDRPTPDRILQFIKEDAVKPENHTYPIGRGHKLFKEAVIRWMKKRFNVELSDKEVLALIGAKDGITHLPLAYLNPGDIVLIPDPGYPGYIGSTLIAGGTPYIMPLTKENKFLPDLKSIPEDIYKKSKIMFLNYPNNPTSAMAGLDFYEEVVHYAQKYDFIIAQDAPYSEIYFGKPPVSILEIKGAKKNVIEFYSMSKTFNMTGWRVGYACGGEEIINGLGTVKENMDSGTVTALQKASARALDECDKEVAQIRALYKRRAEVFYKGLKSAGFNVLEPLATLYLWVTIPDKYTSMEFASRLMEEAGIVVTPGIGFGKSGDKYIRIALTVEEEVFAKALERLKKFKA